MTAFCRLHFRRSNEGKTEVPTRAATSFPSKD